MNDAFLFAEDEPEVENTVELEPYHILIVDDDQEIHTITKMALNEFKLDGHPLTFTSAYSGAEARELLSQSDKYAMTLLDVVMENDHAGLDTARWIREERKNHLIRIVLRTGQPGQAPEEEVIAKYDIDDYKEKTELTYRKLVTLMYSCLRAYRDLCAIEGNKRGLEKVLLASAEVFSAKSIQNLCQGILEQIVALLTRSDDAAYCKLNGFTATAANKEPFEIISGTGDYAQEIGKNINHDVDPEVVARLEQSDESSSELINGHYYGIYTTSFGNKYLLFIRNIRTLTDLDKKLLNTFINNSAIAIENMTHNKVEMDAQRDLLFKVGEAIDKHSVSELSHHVKRTAEIAGQLALMSGSDAQAVERLKVAAAVYDIGKVAVQHELAKKTDVLSVHDYEEIMNRVIEGHDYLADSNSDVARIAAKIAHDFHERWDGTGYPSGKQGDAIDHNARILALASHYDTLRSKRVTREPMSLKDTIAYVQQHSGRYFDPEIGKLMLDNIELIEKIRAKFAD